MKKPNITNGKWIYDNYSAVINSDLDVIAECSFQDIYYYSEELKEIEHSNAKAISAVPDMIDALMELVFLNQCELEGLSSGQPSSEHWFKAFENAENALKKAGCTE